MRNPNHCRYIMLILIMLGLMLSGISGWISGVETLHPLFIIGIFISFGAIIFRCSYHPLSHLPPWQLHLKDITPDNFCSFCGEKASYSVW